MNEDTREILIILQEECAEVTQAISKIFRFGSSAEHNGRTNQSRLSEEVGDLLCMIDLLVERGIVSDTDINQARLKKREKLQVWSGIFD